MSKPKRITDGWYIFEPSEKSTMADYEEERLVVEVRGDWVYTSGASHYRDLDQVKRAGAFIERIDLYKGRGK